MTRFVIYTRLGPEDRSHSGRSLSAQRRDIAFFLGSFAGAAAQVAKRFCDRNATAAQNFPALAAALELCRLNGAELLVARLDRIPFDRVGHAAVFADPGIRLRVAGLPYARKSELQIYARMIAQERAFDLEKQQTDQPHDLPRAAAGKANGERRPSDIADHALPIVLPMRESGSTLSEIASALNQRGWTTENGTAWRPTHVSRLLRDLR